MNANSFCDHKFIEVTQDKWDEYKNYQEVEFKGSFLPSDSDYLSYDKYNWKMVYRKGNDVKYGRMMVSEEYKLKRGLTMGEFYGSSCVD